MSQSRSDHAYDQPRSTTSTDLTADEWQVFELLKQLMEAVMELDVDHLDQAEFVRRVRALQDMILALPTRRRMHK